MSTSFIRLPSTATAWFTQNLIIMSMIRKSKDTYSASRANLLHQLLRKRVYKLCGSKVTFMFAWSHHGSSSSKYVRSFLPRSWNPDAVLNTGAPNSNAIPLPIQILIENKELIPPRPRIWRSYRNSIFRCPSAWFGCGQLSSLTDCILSVI